MEASVPARSRRPAGNTATVWLKIIALVFMFIDHSGKMLFPSVPEIPSITSGKVRTDGGYPRNVSVPSCSERTASCG